MADEARQRAIAFGPFRLDLSGGRLSRAGETIPLRPKTWSVLLHLVERPGVLVTKDELLDAVWPGIAVTPDTLTKSIGELRLALSDDHRTQRCIETVHRRGFRFIAETSRETPLRLPLTDRYTARGPLVGRAAELGALRDLFERACAGERQIAFVTGGAGIGKTALVETFLTAVGATFADAWIAHGSCLEQHGPREAYMPVLDALEGLARQPHAGATVTLLQNTAPTWFAQIPWLSGDQADALRRSQQAARPERMPRELAAFTEALTAERPLVLVLEDLHWSDPSTVNLLSVLAARREPSRLLVIGTYRPAEVAIQEHTLAQAARTLRLRRQCVQLPLHELTEEDIQSYLEGRFPGAEFPPRLAPVLQRYTDGNALFMGAFVDHMLSRGWIVETAPGWALTIAPDERDLGVPDDARQLIEMQLGSLVPADRDLLEAASVAGAEFAAPAVAAALRCTADDAEMRCEALARAHRFLRLGSSAEWPDGSPVRRYTFAHELYRQVAYAGIPDGRRQRLHQHIGTALEAAYGERADEIAPELAVHFERAREHTRALRYLAAAAARARHRFASQEALGYLDAALALVPLLPERARRPRELELRLARAPALSDIHGFAAEPVRENANRTYTLCTEVGTPEQRFQALYALCHLHTVRADLDTAPAVATELDSLAQRLGTVEHRILADSLLLRNATNSGEFVAACELAQRLAGTERDINSPALSIYGAEPIIAARCHYAVSLWMTGHIQPARATLRASLAAAETSGSLFTLTAATWFACLLEVLSRNGGPALELAERVVALSGEQGFVYWNALARALRGWARIEHGQDDEGIEDLECAIAEYRAAGARTFSTYMLAFLAGAHLRHRRFAEGLLVVDEALSVAAATRDRGYYPELWRLKGELLQAAAGSGTRGRPRRGGRAAAAATGEGSSAEQCLRRAVEAARAAGAKSLELRAATSLARAEQASGKAKAGAALADICGWFGSRRADASLRSNADLAEGRALLAELSRHR